MQAESIENHFAQQKLLKPMLVYQHNMGGTYAGRPSSLDEVKKAANKLGLEVDAMRREMDEVQTNEHQHVSHHNNPLHPSLTTSKHDARYAWSKRRKNDLRQSSRHRHATVRS